MDTDILTLVREIQILRDRNLELEKLANRSKLARRAVGFVVYASRSNNESLAESAQTWLEIYNGCKSPPQDSV